MSMNSGNIQWVIAYGDILCGKSFELPLLDAVENNNQRIAFSTTHIYIQKSLT